MIAIKLDILDYPEKTIHFNQACFKIVTLRHGTCEIPEVNYNVNTDCVRHFILVRKAYWSHHGKDTIILYPIVDA